MPDTLPSIGVIPYTTIEIRRSMVDQWTKFGSLMSGATILLLTDEAKYAVSNEYDGFMEEVRLHYGTLATNLVRLTPPIQAAFNKLLNAVARYRLQMDSAK